MIDIHSHILFGVDDGAKTIEESIDLIKEAADKKVTDIIFTPHFNKRIIKPDSTKTLANFEMVKEAAEKEKIKVNLHLGNELYYDRQFVDMLEKREFNTLANSNYIMIEFSTIDIPKNIPEICYEIMLKGYIPIIAHVERYLNIKDDNIIREILNEGAHLQVNADAILGRERKERQKIVMNLLKKGYVSFVASDVHNKDSRSFQLDKAFYAVKKAFGEEYALQIFKYNQQNIISNKYFDNLKMKPYAKRGFLSKLFRIINNT